MLSYSSISIIPGKFNKLFLTISDVNRSGRREVKIMDEIELKVHDMSSTLQPADAYALELEEVNGNSKLPNIIGSLEAQAIKVVMIEYKMPRPSTHDVFLTVTKALGAALKHVLIYNVKDGGDCYYLFLEKEGAVF